MKKEKLIINHGIGNLVIFGITVLLMACAYCCIAFFNGWNWFPKTIENAVEQRIVEELIATLFLFISLTSLLGVGVYHCRSLIASALIGVATTVLGIFPFFRWFDSVWQQEKEDRAELEEKIQNPEQEEVWVSDYDEDGYDWGYWEVRDKSYFWEKAFLPVLNLYRRLLIVAVLLFLALGVPAVSPFIAFVISALIIESVPPFVVHIALILSTLILAFSLFFLIGIPIMLFVNRKKATGGEGEAR